MAVVLHTYFTDGLFGWAKLFLHSFKFYNGCSIKILVSSRDLSEQQINRLHEIYPNIIITNKTIDLEFVAKRAGVDVPTIKLWKHEVEHSTPIYGGSDIWKKYISVEDRYRNSILEAFSMCKNGDHILHCDIDTYFRGGISPLLKLVCSNDISIRFRPKAKSYGNRVLACMIGFKVCRSTKEFMRSLVKRIDATSLVDKAKKGRFSQIVFYDTYLEYKKKIHWGNIPVQYSSPKRDKNFKIWSGCVDDSDTSLKACLKDFKC